jgi:hypothetical protein
MTSFFSKTTMGAPSLSFSATNCIRLQGDGLLFEMQLHGAH